MRTALAIAVGVLIALAMAASFSEPLGLDALWPEFEARKTWVVGAVFVVFAVAGLFHRAARRWRRRNAPEDGR